MGADIIAIITASRPAQEPIPPPNNIDSLAEKWRQYKTDHSPSLTYMLPTA